MQEVGKVGKGQGKYTLALQSSKLTSSCFSVMLCPCYIYALTHFDKPLNPQTCHIVCSTLRPHLSTLSHSSPLALMSPGAGHQANSTVYSHHEQTPELKHPTLQLFMMKSYTAQIKQHFNQS